MSSELCPYCKKPFKPGEMLTSNEMEDVVHYECEMEIERECERKYPKNEGR